MFILKGFILINNQLLSTANAKDINTDYFITNSTFASRYHGRRPAIKLEGSNLGSVGCFN